MSDDQYDLFCWVCGKKNTSLKCSNCERTYHKKCTGSRKDVETQTWVCQECNRQDDDVFE